MFVLMQVPNGKLLSISMQMSCRRRTCTSTCASYRRVGEPPPPPRTGVWVSHRRARPCRRAAAAVGAQAREREAANVGARASTAAAAAKVQASRCRSRTGRTAALGLTMATRARSEMRDRADTWIQIYLDEYVTNRV